MPGSAAHGGHRVHAVSGRADDAVLRALAADLGVEPLDDDRDVGVALYLHLVPLPGGAECPCGVEVFLTHQPVHRHTYDGFAVDERLPVELAARDLTGLDDAQRRLDRRGRHGDFLGGAHLRVGVEAHLVDDHLHGLDEPAVEHLLHRPGERLVRHLAEAHDVPQHIGCFVGPQIGKLLGANECHASGERREQQRELLADTAWRHAGAVQRDVAFQRRLPHRRGTSLAGVEPADRGHHVLAGPQQRGHLVGVGHQRRIDDRVGVQGDDLVDTVGRGEAEWLGADDLADVLARLVLRMHPAADELEVRVLQHTLDRGDPDASGGPLHDPKAHVFPPRSVKLEHVLLRSTPLSRAGASQYPSRAPCCLDRAPRQFARFVFLSIAGTAKGQWDAKQGFRRRCRDDEVRKARPPRGLGLPGHGARIGHQRARGRGHRLLRGRAGLRRLRRRRLDVRATGRSTSSG